MAYPTNPIYKLNKSKITGEISVMTVKGTHTFCIPFDEANSDYQEYLQWKADGGVAEAAD